MTIDGVFFPTITLPTRIANNTISLIDNILTNIEKYPIRSGNIISGISDHLPQFALFDTDSKKQRNNESYFRDYRSLNKVHFIDEFNNIDWNVVLALDKSDPNISFDSFFSKLDDLIKKHVPLKKVSNKQRKSKPWITKGIRRSIQQKNKILKQYINCLLYTSPSPRDQRGSRMPSSA